MEPTADRAATWQSFADILPFHSTAPQLNDQGIFLGRPFGLFLRGGLGGMGGLQSLGRQTGTRFDQRWAHGGRTGGQDRSCGEGWRNREARARGIIRCGIPRGVILILRLEEQ